MTEVNAESTVNYRQVLKTGVTFRGGEYWHPDLALLLGQTVLVKAAPGPDLPDKIEVFDDKDRWKCTAVLLHERSKQ